MIDSFFKTDAPGAECFKRLGVAADPRTAALTRDEFASWLQRAFDLDRYRVSDLRLAIYEALANIAEFAYPATGKTGTMDVLASHDPTESALAVTVADRGLWRTAAPSPLDRSRGRGIVLMKALADRASIQTSTGGTTVRLVWTGVHTR